MPTQIPILNLADYRSQPAQFLRQLDQGYREWGFAGITGHGIRSTTIAAAMQMAQHFFSLPVNEKSRLKSQQSWARGYVPFGLEKAKGATHTDLKEFFHIGRESGDLGGNIWPTADQNLSEFKLVFERLYQDLDELSLTLLSAFAQILGQPADFFHHCVQRGEALLRVLHYPPISQPDVPNVRAAAHEDINLITLLVGSEQEGLEVLSRQGEWVPISMIEGTIICNVGDMLQRLSNGALPSTTHRVVNPKGIGAKQSRYSMPFFVHPESQFSLACLPQCCSDENPKQFEDILAGDYHAQRLREIGF